VERQCITSCSCRRVQPMLHLSDLVSARHNSGVGPHEENGSSSNEPRSVHRGHHANNASRFECLVTGDRARFLYSRRVLSVLVPSNKDERRFRRVVVVRRRPPTSVCASPLRAGLHLRCKRGTVAVFGSQPIGSQHMVFSNRACFASAVNMLPNKRLQATRSMQRAPEAIR
jgi:hypothetical protein